MPRALSASCLIGALLAFAALVFGAGAADTSFPVYRDVEMEKRRQAEPKVLQVPSAEREMMATTRAKAAVRARDIAELASAARDVLVHAPESIAAGWERAARFWANLYRSSKAFADGWDHGWQERYEARRVAKQALREAAYGLYSAYRASSDPGFASEVLDALSSVQPPSFGPRRPGPNEVRGAPWDSPGSPSISRSGACRSRSILRPRPPPVVR